MRVARRVFAGMVISGGLGWAVRAWLAPPTASSLPEFVEVVGFNASGEPLGVARVRTMRLTDDEWRRRLTVSQFMMTRRADTEFAFTGEYWNTHASGLYRCVCCETALFHSEAKFGSGTGWPSFYEPVASQNVTELADTSIGLRTEVKCRRCDAHLGHLFDDGPQPTGKRYCINSVALRLYLFT